MDSKKEKCYVICLVFFFLATIGLLVGLLYMTTQKKYAEKHDSTTVTVPKGVIDPTKAIMTESRNVDEETCLTKQCTVTASMLIEAMDTSVDPCHNFHEFTCANFKRTNPVPADQIYTRATMTFFRNFHLQQKNLVEGMGSLKGPKVMYRMQEAYHVCLNTSFQREKEFLAFKNFTQKTLNWPFASGGNWTGNNRTLTDYMAMIEENGLQNAFVSVYIKRNKENATQPYKVHIWDKSKRSFFANPSVDSSPEEERKMNRSINFLRDVIYLLGNKDDKTIDSDIKQIWKVVDYAQELAKELNEQKENSTEDSAENMATNITKLNKRMYNNITFWELTELTGGKVNWLQVVNKMFRGKHIFSDNDNVNINDEDLFRHINLIAEKFPLRVLANIIGWEALFPTLLQQAGPDIEELLDQFRMETAKLDDKENYEAKNKIARWKKCLFSVQRSFMLVVTRMFIEAYVDRNDKQSANEMIQWIQEAYKKSIRDSDWLDEETRQNAIEKADAIKRFVGYPDYIFDDKALDKAHETVLPEVRSTHFQNVVEMISDTNYQKIPDIKETKENWIKSPLVVNAYYYFAENSIWFPSAILQMPYFQNNRLAAMNFGMIGAVIGHELGHAFDDDGSHFDVKGEINDWWSDQTREVFEKKSECFVEQYNNFCPEYLQGGENDTRICVNGRFTLGENLADNTGLDAAFMAYRMWVEKHGAEKRLPGLREFTPEQLFFISYAYIRCENIPADKWVGRYSRDSHAPAKYRVLGTTSNSRYFREVFNCPVGPMNRGENSCTMW